MPLPLSHNPDSIFQNKKIQRRQEEQEKYKEKALVEYKENNL